MLSRGRKKSIAEQKESALNISIKEGVVEKFSFGLGHSFITNFALALKASSLHIGLLSSFSGLLPQLVQPLSNKLMEKYSRKSILANFIFIETLFWIPISIIAFLFWRGYLQNSAIYLVIIFYILLVIFRNLGYPAWFSWMGDLVPKNERGKYFSKRNLIVGIIEIFSTILGIIVINSFEKKNLLLVGLGIFFLISCLFRFFSYLLIKRQYEPPFRLEKKSSFFFWQFVKRYDNFGKFAVFQGAFYFAIMFASPFFTVYMIRKLGFSVATSVAISLCGSLFYLLFLPLIGKISDKYGNLKLLYIASFSFALSPILWTISKNPFWLGIGPQIFIGLANAAWAISFTNFSYDAVSPKHRGLCISYTNILIGIGTFLGSLLGGFLLSYEPIFKINLFFVVFVISAVLRLSVALFFLSKIKEEKKVNKMNIVSLHLSHPFRTIYSEIGLIDKISKNQYSQGLKIWQDSDKYVLSKKSKRS